MKRFYLFLLVAISVLSMASCSSDNNSDVKPTPSPEGPKEMKGAYEFSFVFDENFLNIFDVNVEYTDDKGETLSDSIAKACVVTPVDSVQKEFSIKKSVVAKAPCSFTLKTTLTPKVGYEAYTTCAYAYLIGKASGKEGIAITGNLKKNLGIRMSALSIEEFKAKFEKNLSATITIDKDGNIE